MAAVSGEWDPANNWLAELELALEGGDLDRARDVVSLVRHAVQQPADTKRLRIVGGVELTDRESATLRCLTDGSLSQKDIARELHVSRNTVKTHLKSLYQKLGVHCRGEAIDRARELGLLPPPVAPAIPLRRSGSYAIPATAS